MRRHDTTALRNGAFRPATANSPLRFSKRKLVVPLDHDTPTRSKSVTKTTTNSSRKSTSQNKERLKDSKDNELQEFRNKYINGSSSQEKTRGIITSESRKKNNMSTEKKALQVDRFASSKGRNRNSRLTNSSMGRNAERGTTTSTSITTRGPSPLDINQPSNNKSTNHHIKTPKTKSNSIQKPKTSKTYNTTVQIEFESLLRIRPFTLTEQQSQDRNVLTTPSSQTCSSSTISHPHTLLLHPLTKPTTSRQKECSYEDNVCRYHFDSIVKEDCTGKEMYEDFVGGLDMAYDVVSPLMEHGKKRGSRISNGEEQDSREIKNHVILSMGISNSGKTYSLFGNRYNTQHSSTNLLEDDRTIASLEKDGIALRLIEDLFVADNGRSMDNLLAQSDSSSWDSEDGNSGTKDRDGTKAGKSTFGVELSMVHVHNEHVFDMLSPYAADIDGKDNTHGSSNNHPRSSTGSHNQQHKKQSNVMKMAASFESIKNNYKASLTTSNINRNNISSEQDPPLVPMQELKISQDRRTSDFVINPTIMTCSNPKQVIEYMDKGMEYSTTSSTKLNQFSSRGHTMITFRPVLVTHDDEHNGGRGESKKYDGGSITIIDMAGIERTKTSAVRGRSMRESIAINGSSTAVLQCLRAIKHNQSKVSTKNQEEKDDEEVENQEPPHPNSNGSNKAQLVPYRGSKLTMLMQPLFSGSLSKGHRESRGVANTKVKTNVLLLVSVYPGIRDYNEKKSLLLEIDSLRGLTVSKSVSHQKRRRRSSSTIIDPISDSTTSVLSVKELQEDIKMNNIPNVSEMNVHHRCDENDQILQSPSKLPSSPTLPLSSSKVSTPLDSPVLDPLDRKLPNGSSNNEHHISTMKSPLKQQSPLKRLSHMVNPLSCKKRKAKEEEDAFTDRIQFLEKKNISLVDKNEAMETKCKMLQEENINIMTLLEESRERERELSKQLKEQQQEQETKRGTKRKPDADDTFFQTVREVRRKEQSLLPSPLRRHMEEVEQNELLVYGGIAGPTMGRCFKEPFSLSVPDKRQPRPFLQAAYDQHGLQFLSQLDGKGDTIYNLKQFSDENENKVAYNGETLEFLSKLDEQAEKNSSNVNSDSEASA